MALPLSTSASSACDPYPGAQADDAILVVRGDTCELCTHALAVLDRVSSRHQLRVRILHADTEQGRAALLAAGAAAFTPVLLLNGRPYAYGRLSERALHRDLTATQASVPHNVAAK